MSRTRKPVSPRPSSNTTPRKAQLRRPQANDVKAQSDLVRYKQLVEKQEISQQLYDQAVARRKPVRPREQPRKAQRPPPSSKSLRLAPSLLQAEANLRDFADRPAAGGFHAGARTIRCGRRTAEAGGPGTGEAQSAIHENHCAGRRRGDEKCRSRHERSAGPAIIHVVPLADVWVTANFKETQLKNMRPGQRAEIKVDANGRTYKGHVDSIAGSSGARFSLLPPENATGNYVKVVQRIPVKIVFDPGQNSDHYLRLGMSVEPKVYVK